MELVFKFKTNYEFDLCKQLPKWKNGISMKWYQYEESQSQSQKQPEKMGPRRKPLIDSGHVDHFHSDTHKHIQL